MDRREFMTGTVAMAVAAAIPSPALGEQVREILGDPRPRGVIDAVGAGKLIKGSVDGCPFRLDEGGFQALLDAEFGPLAADDRVE